MSYIQKIINERPAYFFPLQEGAFAFHDFMGGVPASVNGSPIPSVPLVVGGTSSYVLNGNDNLRFASRLFGSEDPSTTFSLEAWFKPVTVTSQKGIIGHSGQTDGLSYDGEYIYFTTSHGTAGDATARFAPSISTGSFHVVGVHAGSKNELYVNGVRVASTDLTEQQLSTPYQASISPGFLYIGHLSGSIIVDSVAVYSQALSSRQVTVHYLWGKDVPDFKDIVSNRGGTYWDFTDQSAKVLLDLKFDSQEEWETGDAGQVIVTDSLSPAFDENNLTVAGTWQGGVILSAIADTLQGSKIEWDSDGSVLVETSLDDGDNWSPAVSGKQVDGIASNFQASDKSLEVKVTFAEGEPETTVARMRSLSVKLYGSRDSSASLSGQDAVFDGNFALSSEHYQPMDNNDKSGAYLYNARVSVPADSARTIEMWVELEKTATTDQYIFDARPSSNSYLRFAGVEWSTPSGTTIYVNGVARSGPSISIPLGRLTHIVAVLPNGTTGPILLGDEELPMNVALYANYATAMSASQVANLYAAYLGIPSMTISEASGLQVSDTPGKNIVVSSYSWSLTGSG